MKFLTIISILFLITTINSVTAGNILKPTQTNNYYYPETNYELTLTNLTLTEQYALLIGANQLSTDQSWYNFTAIAITQTITINHFRQQSLLDNNSEQIEVLLLVLYNQQNIQLDYYYLPIKYISEDLSLDGWANFIGPFLILLFFIFFAYIIVKEFILKM